MFKTFVFKDKLKRENQQEAAQGYDKHHLTWIIELALGETELNLGKTEVNTKLNLHSRNGGKPNCLEKSLLKSSSGFHAIKNFSEETI